MCLLGWQESLAQLAMLVEPEIRECMQRRDRYGERRGAAVPAAH